MFKRSAILSGRLVSGTRRSGDGSEVGKAIMAVVSANMVKSDLDDCDAKLGDSARAKNSDRHTSSRAPRVMVALAGRRVRPAGT